MNLRPWTDYRAIRPAGTLFALLLLTAIVSAPTYGDSDYYVPGQILVTLRRGASIDDLNERYGTTTVGAVPEDNLYCLWVPDGVYVPTFIEQLESDPDVDRVERNYTQETPEGIRQMVISAGGGDFGDYVDQDAALRIGTVTANGVTRGAGVVVAILDTGIDPQHPLFAGRISPDAYDFLQGDADPTETANGIDDDGDGLVDEGFGHGTMVAGIVALVAPDATILPLRVLDDEGHGQAFLIAAAMRYALNHGADVFNLSFGARQTISSIGNLIGDAKQAKVPVVAGAGNNNMEEPPLYPAIDSKAFMVTALDPLDRKAYFADYESHVVVSAPGVGIRSAFPGGGWASGSGCSFATPFVAGEIALLRSAYPTMGLGEIEDRLRAGVVPVDGLSGNENFQGKLGAGRIDLAAALGVATVSADPGPVSPPPKLLAVPNPSRGAVVLEGGALGGTEAVILDASGRLVTRLTWGPAGWIWDGTDKTGRPVSPGIYYGRVATGDSTTPRAVRIVRLR